METLELVQGSKEWHDARHEGRTASEAPAMMGDSKHTTRNKLLKLKKTGIVEEVDPQTQKRFDKGHAAEKKIRPYIENIVGEDLFASTGVKVVDGIKLMASFDGLTMDESINWEQKSLNKALREFFEILEIDPSHKIDRMYAIQMEQQMLVSGAEKTIFSASDGDPEDTLWFWYMPDPKLRAEIILGWHQFNKDLATYEVPEEEVVLEKKVIPQLPALIADISGEVKETNIDLFSKTAMDFIDDIKTDLDTDQDFADAETMVKFCINVESTLETVKAQAMAKAETINKLFMTMDDIKEHFRQKRLFLDNLVKKEKKRLKDAMVQNAYDMAANHIIELNNEFGESLITPPGIMLFFDVIKGKRTRPSVQTALDDFVAQTKIESNEVALTIRNNLAVLNEKAANFEFLFRDKSAIVFKPAEDFQSLVANRISQHEDEKAKEKPAAINTAPVVEHEEVVEVTSEPEPDYMLLRRYVIAVEAAILKSTEPSLAEKKSQTLYNRIQKKLLKASDELKDRIADMEAASDK